MRIRAKSTVTDIQGAGTGRRPGKGTLVLVLLALAILVSLGTWQVYRLQWKEALLADIDARIHEEPVPVSEIESRIGQGQAIEYTPMQATGTFDHGRERHFLATYDGQPGFYVYTPLTLGDGKILFVNRGFVPDELKDPAKREDSQVAGTVTITGLARSRLDEKPSMMVPDNDPAKNMFFWKDLDAMASSTALPQAEVEPFFLDADDSPNPGPWPKGGVTQIDLPNNHLSYAVTWYGLAIVLAVITILSYRRNRQNKDPER